MAGENLMTATSVAGAIQTAFQLTGADDILLSVGVGQSVIVKTAVICNVSNDTGLISVVPGVGQMSPSNALVSLALVPNGGTADGSNRVISLYNLTSGDSLSLTGYIGGAQLGPGDSIHASTDSGSAGMVNVVITGVLNS